MPDAVIRVLAGVVGAIMGSAMTAIAYRVPRGASWLHGRSACPKCGHVLGVLDLVPVLSWALNRGRCRYCKAPVSARYPATELLCGAWSVLLLRMVGLTWAYPLLAVWGFMLVALLWIDLDFQLLPDALTFPGTLIAIGAAMFIPGGPRHALLGVITGSGLLWLLAWGYLRLRKIEGMGGGDIKLAAMFGAVLGWQLTLLTLFLAAFAGSIWGGALMLRKEGDGKTALPFGTLLCPAAMVVFLWGSGWIHAYQRLFR